MAAPGLHSERYCAASGVSCTIPAAISTRYARAVLRGVAGAEAALLHEPPVRGTPLRLAVVVRAEAAGQEPEAPDRREGARHRVGDRLLEPAVGAGAHAGQHDARVPGVAQDRVEAPFPPEHEEVPGAAAADVDHVLLEDEAPEVRRRSARSRRQDSAS